MNDHLVLVSGKSASGKSASLINLPDPAGVMYLNCECNKKLPFKSKFMEASIIDPLQVYDAFTHAETLPNVHTIVVDSLTFMMNMYESMYVLTSTNTMKAWGDYAQFFARLMQDYVAKSTKNVVMIGHTMDVMNETELIMETVVKVKGSHFILQSEPVKCAQVLIKQIKQIAASEKLLAGAPIFPLCKALGCYSIK